MARTVTILMVFLVASQGAALAQIDPFRDERLSERQIATYSKTRQAQAEAVVRAQEDLRRLRDEHRSD
jgi:hypothetical protein